MLLDLVPLLYVQEIEVADTLSLQAVEDTLNFLRSFPSDTLGIAAGESKLLFSTTSVTDLLGLTVVETSDLAIAIGEILGLRIVESAILRSFTQAQDTLILTATGHVVFGIIPFDFRNTFFYRPQVARTSSAMIDVGVKSEVASSHSADVDHVTRAGQTEPKSGAQVDHLTKRGKRDGRSTGSVDQGDGEQ